jgi:hypothetical protein
MAKTGRPSSFREEYSEQAFKLCLLGATDKQLADFFEVSEQTLNAWKKARPEFLESLKRGKDQADATVAQSLYRRALGYSHDAVKIFNDQGKPLVVPHTEHYPPDTTACIFWLKNRQKDKWSDKQDHEVTGKDGGPIQTEDVSARELIAGRIAGIAERRGTEGGSGKPH